MYAIYNIHPQTLNITIRSLHKTYTEATTSLKKQVTDYVTIYKGYQTILYINNTSEIDSHPDTKYFLKFSDKFTDRISIYEQTTKIDKGYVYNSVDRQFSKIMIFSILDLSIINETDSTDNVVVYDNIDFIQKMNNNSKNNISHGKHVNLIEELKERLDERRIRFKQDLENRND